MNTELSFFIAGLFIGFFAGLFFATFYIWNRLRSGKYGIRKTLMGDDVWEIKK